MGLAAGCGNRCERLCRDAGAQLEICLDGASGWDSIGARGRADFVATCQADWDRVSAELTTGDFGEAVAICGEAQQTLESLSCDELRYLFGR